MKKKQTFDQIKTFEAKKLKVADLKKIKGGGIIVVDITGP